MNVLLSCKIQHYDEKPYYRNITKTISMDNKQKIPQWIMIKYLLNKVKAETEYELVPNRTDNWPVCECTAYDYIVHDKQNCN